MTHYQWILARSILTVTFAFLQKAPQIFGRKTHHIRQFEKVYGMCTIITIVKADYCLMSQLLLNILSNVTLPSYHSVFVHFKHTFVTHPTKISRFFHNCHATPPKKILNVHQTCQPSWQTESSARVYARYVSLEIVCGSKDKNFLGHF